MKKSNLLIILITSIVLIQSCKKEKIEITNPDTDSLAFVGKYKRTYDIIGADFVATYILDSTEIFYSNKGNGPGNTDYTIIFDSYNEQEKRWIGHTENFQYYLLFFKDIEVNSISIYKQKVGDPNEAQTIPIPSEDDSRNYGWNTYYKFE